MSTTKQSPHFFARDADGSTRVRLRFTAEEASLYEEAAGSVPLMHWIHQALNKVAHEEVAAVRASRPKVRPE